MRYIDDMMRVNENSRIIGDLAEESFETLKEKLNEFEVIIAECEITQSSHIRGFIAENKKEYDIICEAVKSGKVVVKNYRAIKLDFRFIFCSKKSSKK